MRIDENKLAHWIEHFFGYGSWDSRAWFVAFEEGGGDLPEDVADRVNYFWKMQGSSSELCDLRDLYEKWNFRFEGPKANLYKNHSEYRFGIDAVSNTVWKNLAAFIHGYWNEEVPDLMEYQRHTFASTELRREALIKLFPLPSSNNHAWYYSWLEVNRLSFLRSRSAYQDETYGRRIDLILQNIRKFKPEVVLMYGMSNINSLKRSVEEHFPSARFKMVKGIPQQLPQHHRADVDGVTILITTQIPALRHNRIETGFDWRLFGETVRSAQP